MAAGDHVVGALDLDEWRAGQLGQPPRARRWAGRCPPCHGRSASGSGRRGRSPRPLARSTVALDVHVGDHRVDGAIERPLDGIVDLLRRVRLRRDLLEEEAHEPGVVRAASSGGSASPSPRRSRARRRTTRRSSMDAAARGAARRRRRRRSPDAFRAGSPRARIARQTPSPHRPIDDGGVSARGVHDGLDVAEHPRFAVRVGIGRPIRQAVAAPVEGDDPVRPAQVRDLTLPLARMDDRGRGQQQRASAHRIR